MHIQDAEKILSEIKQILDNNNIVFFLRHGTCLGAVRDGKLLPWDDDIDIGSIIGMHDLNELSIYKAVENFKIAGYQAKVLETNFHIGVELTKFSIPIDWTCYRVQKGSIFQYPGVNIPAHIHEDLASINLLGQSFYVPNPPEKYLKLKYGPDWRVPKKVGFEADIINTIPETINLGRPGMFTRIVKLFFPGRYMTKIKILSSVGEPIKMIEVAIVGVGKRVTDHDGSVRFVLYNEDYYAVSVGTGKDREILYVEMLKPGGKYFYIANPNEKHGRIHMLKEEATIK